MCQIFSTMRTAGGEVFKILVPPLYDYITLIVDNENCSSDEYECLNIQVCMSYTIFLWHMYVGWLENIQNFQAPVFPHTPT